MTTSAIVGIASFDGSQRFSDIETEPETKSSYSIEDYDSEPVLPLKTIIENLVDHVPKALRFLTMAIKKSANPVDGLTQDESAAILLYSMVWKPRCHSLYVHLNDVLRSDERFKLKPYFQYLKFLLQALLKLKPMNIIAWRGIKADLRDQYPVYKTFSWRGFSSCTESLSLLESNRFLGKSGVRTLFRIECETARAIHNHSYYKNISEVLLLPGTQFQVLSHTNSGDGLVVIHLREVQSFLPTPIKLKLRSTSIYSDSDLLPFRQRINSLCSPLRTTRSKSVSYSTRSYQNRTLQALMKTKRKETSIRFPQHPLSMDDMNLISDELMRNRHWTSLYLWKTFLERKHLDILLEAIQMNLNVICIHLDWNRLADEGAAAMARFLESNSSLKGVYMKANGITEAGARELGKMLRSNTTLTYLDLSSNPLGDDGVIALSFAIKQNRTLHSLNLSQTNITPKAVQALAAALEINTTLKILHLNNNSLTDEEIRIITHSLTQNSALTTLHLSSNYITTAGARSIAYLLQHDRTRLRNLFINGNPLGDEGVKAIAHALQTNTRLEQLKLESTGMTIDAIDEIARMLLVNHNLVQLALSGNMIGDEMMNMFVDVFQTNLSLQHLYLNAVNLTDDCLPNLISILKQNNSLSSIELVQNQFSERGKLSIEQAAQINRTCSLYFQYSLKEKHQN